VDLLGSGSYIYSVITNSENSVSVTFDSSKNSIAIRPSLVIALSFCRIAKFREAL
jgi:hypothetical protein